MQLEPQQTPEAFDQIFGQPYVLESPEWGPTPAHPNLLTILL
jgi:hypothetical protein